VEPRPYQSEALAGARHSSVRPSHTKGSGRFSPLATRVPDS
jgi:hypothetical protein